MESSWLSNWSPIVSFPPYHGPYEVGTVDVEIPTSDLPTPSEPPKGAQPTVAFRIFYPCVKPSKSETDRPVRWIPQPQRPTMAALMQFMTLSERNANWLSYLPQHLYWIKLQAHRNAQLIEPSTSNSRWPVTFFSHGLAGSRNAYSHICGDMASKGMVVIAMDHRDGSSPIQHVRATKDSEANVVDAAIIKHEPTDEVWEARDAQLRIRLWEISTVYEALLKMDRGEKVENLDRNTSGKHTERVDVLQRFASKMDILRPGKVCWAGHSFGAATVTQLLKSVYYASERPADAGTPLIDPTTDAAITRQIHPTSPILLLDMWCLSLLSPNQKFLKERPMPSYAAGGPQGTNILAILSEGFYKWAANRDVQKQVLAATHNPNGSAAPTDGIKPHPAHARLRDESPTDSGYGSRASQSPARSGQDHAGTASEAASSDPATTGPYMFYIEKSQHLNQSDFGFLLPWIVRRFAKQEDPETILNLNTRAMAQVMRKSGIEIAGEEDAELLRGESGIEYWMPISTEDVRESGMKGGLESVSRRLSIEGPKEGVAPVDEVPLGGNGSVRVES